MYVPLPCLFSPHDLIDLFHSLQMLKKDEEELEARRKAIIDKRLAEKEAKKHH